MGIRVTSNAQDMAVVQPCRILWTSGSRLRCGGNRPRGGRRATRRRISIWQREHPGRKQPENVSYLRTSWSAFWLARACACASARSRDRISLSP
ncbi:MAG: hypothetical protein ACLTR6_05850 [Clostridium fessum]